jgi:hypothetical protein
MNELSYFEHVVTELVEGSVGFNYPGHSIKLIHHQIAISWMTKRSNNY